MSDKRRKDDLIWVVDCKFSPGSSEAEIHGIEWGGYSSGYKSKNEATLECRFERSLNKKYESKTRFRARGLTEEEYRRWE